MAEPLRVTRVDGVEDVYDHAQVGQADGTRGFYGYRVEATGALTIYEKPAGSPSDGILGVLVATYSPAGWIKANGYGAKNFLRA